MITRNTHVTFKRTKSNLCECHLTSCSTHDVGLHQVFLAKLAHPTIIASELKGDDQSQLALKLMFVFDHNFDTNLILMFKNKKNVCTFPPTKILSLCYNSKQLHYLESSSLKISLCTTLCIQLNS